jgi:hypothetical protein
MVRVKKGKGIVPPHLNPLPPGERKTMGYKQFTMFQVAQWWPVSEEDKGGFSRARSEVP